MPPRIQAGRGELKVSLPLPLLRAFKLAIYDPIRDRSKYRAAGTILTGLIHKWLEDNGHRTSIDFDQEWPGGLCPYAGKEPPPNET